MPGTIVPIRNGQTCDRCRLSERKIDRRFNARRMAAKAAMRNDAEGPLRRAERQRTLDAATILTGFGAHAGARALHNAFVSELVGDSIAAQFWIEVYRVIAARRP